MDNPALIIATISGFISLCGIAFTIYQYVTSGRKKVTTETDVNQANAAGEITETNRLLLATVREEMKIKDDQHATEITALRKEMASIREENSLLRDKMYKFEDVEDWAERLVFQVKSLGAEPVKIRVRNVAVSK